MYSYVEFLIAAAIPWMLSASVAGAVTFARSGRLDRTARAVCVTSLVWPFAFLFTWATRWTLAVLFLGWDHAMDVLRSKVSFRLSGASSSVRDTFGASTNANLQYWLDSISTAWAVLFVATLVVVAMLIVGYRRLGRSGIALFGMLAFPALFAPLFYELMRNFSQIHVTKAYPNVPIAVGVVLAAALFTGTVTRPSRVPNEIDETDDPAPIQSKRVGFVYHELRVSGLRASTRYCAPSGTRRRYGSRRRTAPQRRREEEREVSPDDLQAAFAQQAPSGWRGQRDGIAVERDAPHDQPRARVPRVVLPEREQAAWPQSSHAQRPRASARRAGAM